MCQSCKNDVAQEIAHHFNVTLNTWFNSQNYVGLSENHNFYSNYLAVFCNAVRKFWTRASFGEYNNVGLRIQDAIVFLLHISTM